MTPNPTQKPTTRQQTNRYYSSTPRSTPRTPSRTTPKVWVNAHSTRDEGLTAKTFPNHPRNTKYYGSTRRTPIKTTSKPWLQSTQPKPIQINHGFKCKDSKPSYNGQAMKRDFDYFALSMNWPETACRFLMTKGKTCSIPGIVIWNIGKSKFSHQHQYSLWDAWSNNTEKQMLTSGLFTDCGQITKTNNIAATFQSIVVEETLLLVHHTDNLRQG